MAKTKPEKLAENKTVTYAWDNYGVEGVKQKFMDRTGEPDRLFLFHNGNVLWMEFKRLGEKSGPRQQHRIDELRKWGYSVETCDNYEDARGIIDRYASKFGIKKIITEASKGQIRRVDAQSLEQRSRGNGLLRVKAGESSSEALEAKKVPRPGGSFRPGKWMRGSMGRPRGR